MSRFKIIPSYLFIGLSVLHTIAGFVTYETLTESTLWFFSAGMALFYIGVVNMIQIKFPNESLIRNLTVLSNLIMLVFVVAFGSLTFQENIGNPMAWLLILNSVCALVISASMRTRE